MDGSGPEDLTRTTIGIDMHPRTVRVRMRGDLDAVAAARLHRVLADTITRTATEPHEHATRMTIDLEAVDLLTAAGITVLLAARDLADDRGVSCVLCVNARGRRALALTGLDEVLLRYPPFA